MPGHFIEVARDSQGNAIASATVTVHLAGTSTLATLYSDAGLSSALANPFTSDADGSYEFFAAVGQYKVTVSKTGFTTFTADYVDVGIEGVLPAWVNVMDYGAVGNDVANDAAAIDAALAALEALGGGVLYFPEGTYKYSGAGISHNPGATTMANVIIQGDGPSSSNIHFTSVSNAQAVLLASQSSVGSGYAWGGGIRDITITVPTSVDALVVRNLEAFIVDNLIVYGGASAITVSECRFGRVARCYLNSHSVNGIKVVGETFSANQYTDIQIVAVGATGSGFNYTKSTAGVSDGVFAARVIVNGSYSGAGILLSAPSALNGFGFFSDCVADGTFTGGALKIVNMGTVLLSNFFAVNHATNAAGILLDNVDGVALNGGVAYSDTGASAADLSFLNSVANVVIMGTLLTGPTLSVRVDGTTHAATIIPGAHSAASFCNDTTKLSPAKVNWVSRPVFFANVNGDAGVEFKNVSGSGFSGATYYDESGNQTFFMGVDAAGNITRLNSFNSHPLVFLTESVERLRLDSTGNVLINQASVGTSGVGVVSVKNGTVPSTGPADCVQFYSTDNAAGHTIPSFRCEGTDVLATGQADSASSVRVKVRVNGTVVTLLGI